MNYNWFSLGTFNSAVYVNLQHKHNKIELIQSIHYDDLNVKFISHIYKGKGFPMKTYFFGDIHGNAFALEAVIQHYQRIKPDNIYCLGDLVGWLPFGDRTLTHIRSLNLPTVAGNHDLMVAGLFRIILTN